MAIRIFNSPKKIVRELYQGYPFRLNGDNPMKIQERKMQKSLSTPKMEEKGIISRRTYSSRFSDKVYVDSYYKYDDKLNNFFRIKELIRLSEGTNMIDSIMKIDSIQPSLDGKCNKISNKER